MGINKNKCIYLLTLHAMELMSNFPSIHSSKVDILLFFWQKKAKLAILEQERAEARAKEAHLKKLQEKERKISQAVQETETLRSEVMRSPLFYFGFIK